MARLINIECPHGHVVAIDVKDIGKKVRCPICDVVMRVPASAVPQEVAPLAVATPISSEARGKQDDEALAYDNGRGSLDNRDDFRYSMRRVRLALNLFIARLYILVIGFLLIFAWAFTHGLNQPAGPRNAPAKPPAAMIMTVLAGGIVLIVLEIIALVFAFSTPKKTGARGILMTYTGIQVFFYVLYFFAIFMQIREDVFLGVLSIIVAAVTIVCFIVYLKKLAQFQEQPKLVAKANGLFWLYGFCLAGIIMMYVPLLIDGANDRLKQNRPSDMSLVFMLVGILVTLVAGIWAILRYVRLLNGVRDSLKVYG